MKASPYILAASLMLSGGNSYPNTASTVQKNICDSVNGAVSRDGSCKYLGVRADIVTALPVDPKSCLLIVGEESRLVARSCNDILKDLSVVKR